MACCPRSQRLLLTLPPLTLFLRPHPYWRPWVSHSSACHHAGTCAVKGEDVALALGTLGGVRLRATAGAPPHLALGRGGVLGGRVQVCSDRSRLSGRAEAPGGPHLSPTFPGYLALAYQWNSSSSCGRSPGWPGVRWPKTARWARAAPPQAGTQAARQSALRSPPLTGPCWRAGRVPGAPGHPEWLTEPVWAPLVPVIKLGLLGPQCWVKCMAIFRAAGQTSLSTSSSPSGMCVDQNRSLRMFR